MVDIIYDFIRNSLIGETTISGADNLALMLTWAVIVFAFVLFVRITMWAFYLVRNAIWFRRRGRY